MKEARSRRSGSRSGAKQIISRRQFLSAGVLASVAAVGDAFLIEPNLSSITEVDLRVPRLSPALHGMRVVQLTDFHYKPDKDEALMTDVVEKVNALQPDIIFLTGDYVDADTPNIVPLLGHLSRLNARHGIIACMGNHDGWVNSGEYYRGVFRKLGIDFLINENMKLTIKGESLAVAATDFVWLGKPDPVATLKGVNSSEALITLVHEPDYFDTMLRYRDHHLQLSGHTHGGQCRVPFIGYAPQRVKYGKRYLYGQYAQKNSRVFVSRGIGTTGMRVRFACIPEIVSITLVGSLGAK